MKIKVLMVDDHALFRDGMRYVLQQLADEVEILDTGNFAQGYRMAEQNRDLDLALLDLNMPGSQGPASIRKFHTEFPEIPLVVVSGSEHRQEIASVMDSGAMGYISKMSSSKVMLSALRMVLDGGVYVPPQLLQQTLDDIGQAEPAAVDSRVTRSNRFSLTPRQLDILHFLAEGRSNKEISAAIHLAEGTVKIHVASIFQALHVNTRLDAVNAGRRMGLLPLMPDEPDAPTE